MSRRSALAALHAMPEPENQLIERVTERFERRLAEELGAIRLEIASGDGSLRTEMEKGFGALRAEMIDRNATLLKWLLIYAFTQIGAIAALFALFR
jgi:hypothetical protein